MRLQESGEMYLETVYILARRGGPVRSLDVAEYMEFSKPSVSRAVGLLRDGGYLAVDGNGHLTLTEIGLEIAAKTYERHTTLTGLFTDMGVPEKIAAEDACKIEHDISDATFEALKAQRAPSQTREKRKLVMSVDKIRDGERQSLGNLVKMYCCEWGQYNGFDVDENGVYGFESYLHLYFERPRRFGYFLRVEGRLAGFALIDDDFALHKDFDYSMGEFFVLPKYRRCGAGAALATRLFDEHRGRWEVGFHPKNIGSERFWLKVVGSYTGGDYTLTRDCEGLTYHDGSRGAVLAFDSRATGKEAQSK